MPASNRSGKPWRYGTKRRLKQWVRHLSAHRVTHNPTLGAISLKPQDFTNFVVTYSCILLCVLLQAPRVRWQSKEFFMSSWCSCCLLCVKSEARRSVKKVEYRNDNNILKRALLMTWGKLRTRCFRPASSLFIALTFDPTDHRSHSTQHTKQQQQHYKQHQQLQY